MIEKEYVSLKSDTNFIPVKYAVMDVTVGADIASSYAWIKVVGYGIDTQQHFDDYVTAANEGNVTAVSIVDEYGIVGVLNEYVVVSLSNIQHYSSKYHHADGPIVLG